MELKTPTKATLKKYGLTESEWSAIADRQGRVCYVCGKVPPSGRLHIDHFHAPKWSKLPPADRKRYVRGLLCHQDNRFYVGRITVERSRRITAYLEAFEARRAA